MAGLLDDDPLTHQTSISLAVERYKREDITLGRAAEIAGVTSEEMKRVLADRGVEIRRGFLSPAEREAKARTMGPES